MVSDYEIIYLPEVDSTNNYLKTFSEARKINIPILLIAGNQTKGRGQQKNKWESEAKKNLLLSLLIKEEIPVDKAFYLSKVTALAISKLLENEASVKTKIKWTNDIYVQNKKIAGVLIENTMKGNKIVQSIIGVGINLNQTRFSEQLPNPVSLKQITKKNYDIEDFAIKFFREFYKLFVQFQKKNLRQIDDNYNCLLYKKGEWINILEKCKRRQVKILMVDDQGYLIVENTMKEKEKFTYGDIKFDFNQL